MKKFVISAISFLMIFSFFSCEQEVEKQEVKQETEIEVKPVGLEIAELPNKLSYFTNGTLDLTGLVVKVNNSDGSSEQLSKDKYISQPAEGAVLSKNGNQAVKITAKGKTAFFNIYVEKTVYTALKLKSMPTKTYYKDNEMFDTTGMEVVAAFDDGSERTLEAWEYKTNLQNGSGLQAGSGQKVAITYCGKEVSFYINVGSTFETFTFVDDYENNDANSVGVKNHTITDICRGNTNLRTVVIPDTIETIESFAFENCESLESVELRPPFQRIKRRAFYNCKSLKYLRFCDYSENSPQIYIEKEAFKNCESLFGNLIFYNNTSFDGIAFENCNNIISVEFKDCVWSKICETRDNYISNGQIIGSGFKNCNKLESVDFNNKNSRISFEGCTALKNVKNMKTCAVFKDCTSLENIVLSDECDEIPGYAFYGCSSLENINIPNSVLKIGNKAFAYCSKLTLIQIPYKVEEIYLNAFYGCENLKEIELCSGVTKIQCNEGHYIKEHDIKFSYKGTKSQFNEIELENGNGLNGVTIYCSDGSFVYGEE